MPIQPENKIFPVIVPPSPGDLDSLVRWASDLTKAFNDLSSQMIQKFNLHLDQTNAHPKSWAVWRLTRPEFAYSATDKIVVSASPTQLRYFSIAGTLLEISSDIFCDIDGTGPGGLDEGTKQPTTTYYVYGINNGGVAAIISSDNAPSTGPVGYEEWTYLGSFTTDGSSHVPNPAPNNVDPTEWK